MNAVFNLPTEWAEWVSIWGSFLTQGCQTKRAKWNKGEQSLSRCWRLHVRGWVKGLAQPPSPLAAVPGTGTRFLFRNSCNLFMLDVLVLVVEIMRRKLFLSHFILPAYVKDLRTYCSFLHNCNLAKMPEVRRWSIWCIIVKWTIKLPLCCTFTFEGTNCCSRFGCDLREFILNLNKLENCFPEFSFCVTKLNGSVRRWEKVNKARRLTTEGWNEIGPGELRQPMARQLRHGGLY